MEHYGRADMDFGLKGMTFPFEDHNDQFVQPTYTQCMSQFTDEELDKIVAIGVELRGGMVNLFGKYTDDDVHAYGSRLPLTPETRWIYKSIAKTMQQLNSQEFHYDLSGIYENLYFLTYEEGDHFDWHVDAGPKTPVPRKLSGTLQLTDPADYDGGDFDILLSKEHERTQKRRGMVTAFPAWRIHRVTPITRGLRHSIAIFCTGPMFR